MNNLDPVALALLLGFLVILPLAFITTTSFLKIGLVLSILRSALGLPQSPPNLVLYSLALMLTVFIMAPVGSQMASAIEVRQTETLTVPGLIADARLAGEPLRRFLLSNSRPAQRDFFRAQAQRMWPPELAAKVTAEDFAVVVPAFAVSELTAAFELGFLLFLPFIVIDLIISNILMAMGMMMMSPTTISLPIKLLLFVMADGWTRLLQGLVLTYKA